MKWITDIPVGSISSVCRKELLELNSVLGDYLGLGIVWSDCDSCDGFSDYYELVFCVRIINLSDKSGRAWWFGRSLKIGLGQMMEDLKNGIMLDEVILPHFESVSELRMKLELQGR